GVAQLRRSVCRRLHRAVVEIGDPVRLTGATAGGEAELEGPGAVLPAPGVPGGVAGGLPRGEALGDDVEQAGAAAADGEDAGPLSRPLALGQDRTLVAAHVLQRDLRGLRDVLGAGAGAELGRDLGGARGAGAVGLGPVRRGPVRANG